MCHVVYEGLIKDILSINTFDVVRPREEIWVLISSCGRIVLMDISGTVKSLKSTHEFQ